MGYALIALNYYILTSVMTINDCPARDGIR
jgi:hypothetical protein